MKPFRRRRRPRGTATAGPAGTPLPLVPFDPTGPGELVPDIAGEVVGWRNWMVIKPGDSEPVSLSSLAIPMLWPTDDWVHADCILTGAIGVASIGVPHSGCLCGVYACGSVDELLRCNWAPRICPGDTLTIDCGVQIAGPMSYLPRSGPGIYGTVALAGRVIRHEWGWRAEKARVRSIWDLGAGIGRTMARIYGVPLEPAPWMAV